MKILKRKFLLGIPLAIISFEIYLGVLAGYFLAFFCAGKKTGARGRFNSFVFDLGKYRLHFHHWLIGIGLLPIALYYDTAMLSSHFFSGIAGGLIYQGIACYSDWHRVIIKKL